MITILQLRMKAAEVRAAEARLVNAEKDARDASAAQILARQDLGNVTHEFNRLIDQLIQES